MKFVRDPISEPGLPVASLRSMKRVRVVRYAIKPKKPVKRHRHQNAVEYIEGKSFLFISFMKKEGLALFRSFSVRRSQFQRSAVTRHRRVTYGM